MTRIIPISCKEKYRNLLDRSQAFEVCDFGSDYVDFTKHVLFEMRDLYSMLETGDENEISVKIDKLNKFFDDRFGKYDSFTQKYILEFINSRRELISVEEKITEIGARLYSQVGSQFDLLNSVKDVINTKLSNADKLEFKSLPEDVQNVLSVLCEKTVLVEIKTSEISEVLNMDIGVVESSIQKLRMLGHEVVKTSKGYVFVC